MEATLRKVSLSPFIDFVLTSGSPKLTCAKKIKKQLQEPYDPATDYYARFRDAVKSCTVKACPSPHFQEESAVFELVSKRATIAWSPDIISFWARRKLNGFDPLGRCGNTAI